MAYTKQTWADLPSKTTPINAERLTHIEDGIFNAAQTADTAASTAGTAAANIGIVSGRVETLTGRVNDLDTAVSNKVDKVAGKGLSTNDYDDTDKGKVDSLGTASTKNSTSVVTESSDLVESGAVYTALQSKCDNSVIGTVEDGTTTSQAYAVGSHFIRNGKFCTVTQAISSGGTLTEGTNYTSGDVASCLIKQATFSGTTNANGQMSITNTTDRKVIKVVLNTNFLICLLYQRSDGESIKVIDANFQPWAEQALSGTYYYI